jgi:hypothetical protein
VLMPCARSVLLILFLLAGSLSPPPLEAQSAAPARQGQAPTRSFAIEQNYPNPVNPETWIPFTLGASLFDQRAPATVTIRVFNMLGQVVAIPQAVDHPNGRATPVFNLPYTEPGRKTAYWDGRNQSGELVPTGVYYAQMVVTDSRGVRVSDPGIIKFTVIGPTRRRLFPF